MKEYQDQLFGMEMLLDPYKIVMDMSIVITKSLAEQYAASAKAKAAIRQSQAEFEHQKELHELISKA